MRKTWLIVWTVLIEAIRRREIYAIVLFSCGLIAAIGSIRFFNLEGLGKFYHEAALKVMGLATVATVIVLAARQLPREFERRTIYTLLAKPIWRGQFLLGKFLGVMAAGIFCYGLFTLIFLAGNVYLGARLNGPLFLQHVYLQILSFAVIASLAFMLSLIGNLDMAITVTGLIYVLGQLFTSAITFIYDYVNVIGKWLLVFLNYVVPQLTLFDLSGKVVHGEIWRPLGAGAMLGLTLYAAVFTVVFLGVSYLLFRRRAL